MNRLNLWLKQVARQASLRFGARNVAAEEGLGAFLLATAVELAELEGGDVSALSRPGLREALRNKQALKLVSEAHQFLQTAFERNYERSLFDYYRQQQYLLLLVFLSYPFRGPGCLGSYIEPYKAAAGAVAEPLDILDYGAGIPFGAIDLIRSQPGKVRSITIVDLDLIHTRLSEYVLVMLLGREKVRLVRTTDADAIPDLGGPFNFCFGKDIFEHLNDPRSHLRNILAATAEDAVCYFDLNDHGERYLQHVTPTLSPLVEILESQGFRSLATIRGMSGFRR
jgi:hypothetical protein